MARAKGSLLIPFLLGPVVALEAYCEVFMNETQATASLFPGLKFEKSEWKLTPQEQAQVQAASGEKVLAKSMPVYTAATGERVIIDRVIGKHEYITYAVGIQADGKIKNIEILEYRESYGGQVREPEWRGQFAGKDVHSALRVNSDIRNISGATLSSSHVAAGVRRVLRTAEVVQHRT